MIETDIKLNRYFFFYCDACFLEILTAMITTLLASVIQVSLNLLDGPDKTRMNSNHLQNSNQYVAVTCNICKYEHKKLMNE